MAPPGGARFERLRRLIIGSALGDRVPPFPLISRKLLTCVPLRHFQLSPRAASRLLNPVSSDYAVAPIFLIRMAGVPFDEISNIATPKLTEAARKLIELREQFLHARTIAQDLLALRNNGLAPNEFHSLRSAVR